MTLALLAAAFVAGFTGSAHCAGMCGPIVSLFETQGGALPMRRRLAYQGGRLLTYLFIGAMAGIGGRALTHIGAAAAAGTVLRVIAALALLLIGFKLLGVAKLTVIDRVGVRLWRRVAPLARHVLPLSTAPRALGAGMIWGTLPCGLVYAAAALAIGAGSALAGAAVMAAFWAGTVPALLAVGGAAQQALRPAMRRVAGAFSVILATAALAMLLMPEGHHPVASELPATAQQDDHHGHH